MTTLDSVNPQQAVRKLRRPARLSALLISDSLIQPIEEHLLASGREQCEEAALIAGYLIGGSIAVGTTALLPYTDRTGGGCEIPLDVVFNCSKQVRQLGMLFLAQIHTHPGRYCGHSSTDNHWAVCDSSGFISIVVPCFGRFGLRKTLYRGASVYERMSDGNWRIFPPQEVRQRIHVIPVTYAVV